MRNNILKIVTVMILLMIVFSCKFVYAASYQSETNDAGGGRTNPPPTSDESSETVEINTELFKPVIDVPSGGKTETIIVSLLNILTVLGIIAIVISLVLIGFGSILGSASEKAQGQEKYVGIIVAALIITGGSIIAKLIISIAEEI